MSVFSKDMIISNGLDKWAFAFELWLSSHERLLKENPQWKTKYSRNEFKSAKLSKLTVISTFIFTLQIDRRATTTKWSSQLAERMKDISFVWDMWHSSSPYRSPGDLQRPTCAKCDVMYRYINCLLCSRFSRRCPCMNKSGAAFRWAEEC